MFSFFYKAMLIEDRKYIAKNKFGVSHSLLESWLYCLTDLRNKCAHYTRLYFWLFTATPKIPKEYSRSLDKEYRESLNINRLFPQILMLKFLFPDTSEWNNIFMHGLKALVEEYMADIELKHIGFPLEWE